MTYTILPMMLSRLQAKIDSFSRKFKKYGDGCIQLEISEPYIYEFDPEVEGSILELNGREVIDVSVEGKYQIKGYEFVAALQYDAESGRNIVRGGNVPEEFLTRRACDHCKTNRSRIKTVVLFKDGEYIQVGNSCVKDYLGVNIERYAQYLSFWHDLEELAVMETEMVRSVRPATPVEDVLLETAHRVAQFGYVNKDRAFEEGIEATSSAVWQTIFSNNRHEYTDDHKKAVEAVIEFVNSCQDDGGYVSNLKSLVNNKYVTNKNFGLLVSSFGYYAAEMRKRAREEAASKSRWLWSVGEKVEFTAKPEVVYSYDSGYGYTYIYRFVVEDNEVIWKTGTELDSAIEYKVSGRVKAHNEYRGVKQTEVTRCRVKEIARHF